MMNLLKYLVQEENGKTATIVSGPNGKFIKVVRKDKTEFTIPIGKKSQDGSLADFNALIAEDGQVIATINNYEDEETVTL